MTQPYADRLTSPVIFNTQRPNYYYNASTSLHLCKVGYEDCFHWRASNTIDGESRSSRVRRARASCAHTIGIRHLHVMYVIWSIVRRRCSTFRCLDYGHIMRIQSEMMYICMCIHTYMLGIKKLTLHICIHNKCYLDSILIK